MNDSSRGAHNLLAEQAVSVCEDLYHFLPSQSRVVSWVAGVTKKVLCTKVVELTHPQHGLQFNASNTMSKYLEGLFVQEAAGKMQKYAPGLWDLVHSLLNANKSYRHVKQNPGSDVEMEDTEPKDKEMDLGEYRGHDMHSTNADDNDDVTGSDGKEELCEKAKLTQRQWHAAERNAALLLIIGKFTVHDK
jgi:hypothetical protein